MSYVIARVLLLTLLVGISVLASIGPVKVNSTPSVETVYSGLNFPVAFTFLPDGRMLFNEKNTGNIRVIAANGTILTTPLATLGPLPPGAANTEEGLLGIALDPQFVVNHYVYVYWTYWDGTYKYCIISRFTATGNTGASRTDIFSFRDPNPTQPPSGPTNHNGGYIKFGPDGKLYVEVGDFCSWDCLGNPLAQSLTTYAGKILRMNPDGSVPSGNPFSGSLIWAYGFRNGVGMDFSPSGKLIATMAGPNCCDRIFFINSGANFGWPTCGTNSQPTCSSPPFVPSTYQWGATVTPTGIAYTANESVLYFGEFNTANLMQLILTSTGTVAQLNTIATLGSGILSVERGPDGQIYFSTPTTISRLSSPGVQITVTSAPIGSGFVTVDGFSYSTPHAFSWLLNTIHTIAANSPAPCGTGCQYTWVSWSDGGGLLHTVTTAASPTTYAANFQQQYQLKISVNVPSAGSTNPTAGSYWENAGTTTSVSATPSLSSFSFSQWILDGSSASSANPIIVTMNSPHTVIADFLNTSSISIAVSSSPILLGDSATISGAIIPAQASGMTVSLSYTLDGTSWILFMTTRTDSSGVYSVGWSPPYPETYQVRASWSGNAEYYFAVSSPKDLKVTGTSIPSPNLILVTAATSLRGQTTPLTITIFNPTSTALSTQVTVAITGPNSYTYFDTAQVSVASQSETTIQIDWTAPNQSGNYTVTVALLPPRTGAFDLATIQIV
jgi:glucose/arabinose dehydrogenase